MNRLLPLLFSVVAALSCSAATASIPPAAVFFGPAEFGHPKISPNGKMVGICGTRNFHDYFATIDLSTGKPQPQVTFDEAQIMDFWWKGDRFVVFLVDKGGGAAFRGFDLETRKEYLMPRFNARVATMINPLAGDPDHILATSKNNTGTEVVRINVRTGKVTVLQENIEYASNLAIDRKGQVLAALRYKSEKWSLLIRSHPGEPWRESTQGGRYYPDFMPLGVHPDQKRIIGLDWKNGNVQRLVARDPGSGADEVLFSQPDVDPGYLVYWGEDGTDLRAITYVTDREQVHYFEPADAAFARQIDEALPGYSNQIANTSADGNRLLVRSDSVGKPTCYWLFDRHAVQLSPLTSAQPGLSNLPPSESLPFFFSARDQVAMSARLIRPAGSSTQRPPPVIVLSYGLLQYPFDSGFDPSRQWLVSHGYAVLEVNHRGVAGYGRKFAQLADGNIHTTLADDLADAVKHAAAQGWIDPKRVGLFGGGVAGVTGIYTIARNPAMFSIWLNYNTPLTPDLIPTWELLFDRTAIGQSFHTQVMDETERRLRVYRRSLDPLDAAGQFALPSFHFYFGNGDARLDVPRLKRQLSRSGIPFQCLFSGRQLTRPRDINEHRRRTTEDQVEGGTALLAFLQKNMPAD
jgi:dipeptidyl aminopeptidase/acylaminoacyl peptidase